MEEEIKKILGTVMLKSYGRSGGGCINEGQGFMTDNGPIFVKKNRKPEALDMFKGEMESLKAMDATQTIRVPTPLAVGVNPSGGAWFAAEYLEMNGSHSYQAEMGTQLARLHLHNSEMMKPPSERSSWVKGEMAPVKEFGFHVPTCCGFIPQDNTWGDDWQVFVTEKRLGHQVNLLQKNRSDKELKELWSELEEVIPSFFKRCPEIVPALIHGDLWGGNISGADSQPVIFDPAAFYGHSEFDLGIAMMFGGLSGPFFKTYHALIPKAPGFDQRNDLYQLFHQLNHWNHFGGSYRSSSLGLMKSLIKSAR